MLHTFNRQEALDLLAVKAFDIAEKLRKPSDVQKALVQLKLELVLTKPDGEFDLRTYVEDGVPPREAAR